MDTSMDSNSQPVSPTEPGSSGLAEDIAAVPISPPGSSDFLNAENRMDDLSDGELVSSDDEDDPVYRSGSSKSGGGASTILSTDENSGNGTPQLTTTTNNNDTNTPSTFSPLSADGNVKMEVGEPGVPMNDSNSNPNDDDARDRDSLSDKSLDSDEDEEQDQDDYDSDDFDELDALLEEGLPEEFRGARKPKMRRLDNEGIGVMGENEEILVKEENDDGPKQSEFNLKEITVLVEKGKNALEVLPGGWLEVRHSSGMPLFLHRKSRVCTMSRPYFLGPGSARRHAIPLSAIPCLAYRKALDKEKTQEATSTNNSNDCPASQNQENMLALVPLVQVKTEPNTEEDVEPSQSNGTKDPSVSIPTPRAGAKRALPCARVETVRQNTSSFSVDAKEVRQYCERLFVFKNVRFKRFKTWSARRKHTKEMKRQQLQRPTLPEGVKLITFPIHNSGKEGGKGAKEYVMNPHGKSSVCILHEYVQHAMRQQPTYTYRELENAATPYSAEVVIGDMKYGIGYGSSKKQAKAEAAKATIELFIPQMKDQLDGPKASKNKAVDHTMYFNQVELDDPRITQMCNSISEPSPYTLLLTCLQRNFGMVGSSSVKFEMLPSNSHLNKFCMTTGEYSVNVTASNKREGKQLASQALLAKIHPHIKNFGSFLRLYGNGSIKSVKEKKQEEQQITTLQSKATANSPNYAILNKLRKEMKKIKEQEGKEAAAKTRKIESQTAPEAPPILPAAPPELTI